MRFYIYSLLLAKTSKIGYRISVDNPDHIAVHLDKNLSWSLSVKKCKIFKSQRELFSILYKFGKNIKLVENSMNYRKVYEIEDYIYK